MKVIRIVGRYDGTADAIAGQYLRTFDFEAEDGRGFGEFTHDPAKAMTFPDSASAMAFWITQSKTRPLRLDGKPNRPLTATTVEIVDR